MRFLVVVLSVFLCMSFVSIPAMSAVEEAKPKIDPDAQEILKDMSDYLKSIKEFTVRADTFYDAVLKETGQKIRFSAGSEMSIRRPNSFQIDFYGIFDDKRLFYDGKTFSIYDSDANAYATKDAPATIDGVIDAISERLGVVPPLADLMISNTYAQLSKNIETSLYVGLTEIHGVPVHHLAFTQEDIDWQIWIEDGKNPVPMMIVIDHKKVESLPQYTAILTDWDFYPRLADSLFKFRAPEDALEIEFLTDEKLSTLREKVQNQ